LARAKLPDALRALIGLPSTPVAQHGVDEVLADAYVVEQPRRKVGNVPYAPDAGAGTKSSYRPR